MEGFGAAWANPAGELYRIDRFWPTSSPLATAKDRENGQDQVCVWTNDYRGTRVFGTTLGHHNETVDSPEFIGMLARGTLWASGKLAPEYLKPAPKRFERENLALGSKVTASSEVGQLRHFVRVVGPRTHLARTRHAPRTHSVRTLHAPRTEVRGYKMLDVVSWGAGRTPY
jgi:hypothetical protein